MKIEVYPRASQTYPVLLQIMNKQTGLREVRIHKDGHTSVSTKEKKLNYFDCDGNQIIHKKWHNLTETQEQN